MSKIKGTKTEENLLEAFITESQVRNKYTFFAAIARFEGYEKIAAYFDDAANNEKEHAKVWYKLLSGGEFAKTSENLKIAAAGENNEWTGMYKRMAEDAREEGLDDIAFLFESVGTIEEEHEKQFLKLLEALEENKVFCQDKKTIWTCRNCGYASDEKSAPEKCPVCYSPQAYFDCAQAK